MPGQFDVIVVGAGPAGLMAAIAAAGSGARVALCEQLDTSGRKLLAAGGGRCNLTNRADPRSFLNRFSPPKRPFIRSALKTFSRQDLESFFAARGLDMVCEDGIHVFPATQRASDVLRLLLDECSSAGIQLLNGIRIQALDLADGTISGVKTSRGLISSGRVIVATGGRSYPGLGSNGSGYELARQAGHNIVTPVPALVGLITAEEWPGQCSGIVLPDCRVWIGDRRADATSGDVLFTHHGVSGPAVLDISGAAARQIACGGPVVLRLDPMPGRGEEWWRGKFEEWRTAEGKKQFITLLSRILPRAAGESFCCGSGIDPAIRAGELSRQERERFIVYARAVPLTVTDTAGFGEAMLTAGGVALDDVNPATLESRLAGGLFFAGEVLDIDGPCGGFNLQWAFSSGRLAGSSAGRICMTRVL